MPVSAPSSVVITGASTGIGRACALWLDQAGFQVFATVRREEDAEALAADASPRLRVLLLDVRDARALRRAEAAVDDVVGVYGLDGLINNAGIAAPGPLECLPIEAFREQMEVNVTAQVAVTQAFLPMLRRAGGRIINMGSIGGRSVMPFAGAYCASKFAFEAVTDAWRMELKPWGIEVVIVEPGGIATPIWRKAAEAEWPPMAGDLYGPVLKTMQATVGRIATEGVPPEAVARVVHKALTARRPKTRYLVGRTAYLRLLLERLPDRFHDHLVLRRFTGG